MYCQSEGTHQIVMSIQKKVLKKALFYYGQDIVMAFSPPVVGCLVKKSLAKGGSRAPQDPPGYALDRILDPNEINRFTVSHEEA